MIGKRNSIAIIMSLGLGCIIASAQQYTISTIAGGGFLPTTSVAPAAAIGFISGVASDSLGDIYFGIQNAVLKLDATGVLTVVAGNGNPGDSGDGGPATNAQIGGPLALAVDPAGNLYIADAGNGRIRRVTTDGIIKTIAGSGRGCFCESEGAGDGGPAIAAPLYYPYELAVDAKGNVYLAEFNTARVRRVSPDGIISTVVGTGGNGGYSGDGGPAINAQIGTPWGLAVDRAGNLFISDVIRGDNDSPLATRIRMVSPDGIITTVAGTGVPGYSGDDGPGLNAQFSDPGPLAVDNAGNLYIPDGLRIRKLSSTGIITTIAGDGKRGYSGDVGPAVNAEISGTDSGSGGGLAADSAGNLYVADTGNYRVRKISSNGIIATAAGDGAPCCFFGENGVLATTAHLSTPVGVAIDGLGGFFIADTYSGHIRRVSPTGIISTTAGIGVLGGNPGDGDIAQRAFLSFPSGLAVDASGNLFIADAGGQRIRRITLDGMISTVAGNGAAGFSGDGGLATAAQLNWPKDVAIDAAGNLYIADTGNSAIRKVTPAGIITTIAGNGSAGFFGDGGLAPNSQLNQPSGVGVDGNGNVYVSDTYNFRIRKIDSSGLISTVAGNGLAAYSGDGVAATSAALAYPAGLKVDSAGNLFLADWVTVRKIAPSGIITTIAGVGGWGYRGDGGPATSALIGAWGISLDPSGRILIADPWANVIRVLQPVQ